MRKEHGHAFEEPMEFWWILRWFGAPPQTGEEETGSYTGFPEPGG